MAATVIRNGFVVDGTGAPGFDGDVVVDGDRIVDVLRRDAGKDDSRFRDFD